MTKPPASPPRSEVPTPPKSDEGATGLRHDPSAQISEAGKTLGLDKPLQGPATYSTSSLSLPKGGGAMKAIAEAFRANPATGTGSMSIPLAVTPARGLEPSLTLAYDSGSGNGPVGLGWSLSTGSISRRTDKGLPRYDGADTFLFEGEELVPSLALVGDVWVPEAVTPPSGWDIVRYRPRIEGAFSRIERWTDTATGDVLWKVRDRTNVLRIYGRSAAARIADPSDARKVFSWLLEEVLDDRGNRVVLRYAGDDASRGGLDALSDVARRTSLVDFVQRYPLVVRYGNATPHSEGSTDDDFLFAVVFDWGGGVLDTLGEPDTLAADALDATASEATLLGTPPVRADAFSLRRAGFDVRTRWLCSAVRLYHAIDTDVLAPASPWVPVRTWSMTYDDADHLQKLVSVVLAGHREGDSLSMPATTFTYQARVLGSQVQTLSDRDAAVLPRGVDGRLYRWQDLDGEGLVGLLTEQGGAWWYQRNHGDPARWDRPDLPRPRLGPLRRVTPLPNASLDGGAQLVDLDGDGRAELVVRGEGSQTRIPDARHGWGPFRRFRHMPNVDWSDPNLRFIDLTGDGKADLLLTEERVFRWYPSEGRDGYGAERRVLQATDEAQAPRTLFSDGTQLVVLADMTGDGLQDLVRVRGSSICYWPNLGYGRFGPKVEMAGAPAWGRRFDPSRVRLTDIDGSGTADVVYLGAEGVTVAFNRSGNLLEAGGTLLPLRVDDATTVDTVDLLGDGTACLVWSQPGRPMRYLRLMAEGKPHMLSHVSYGTGVEVALSYAPSTAFYVRDRDAGHPWATRLPFPMQCLERVTTTDHVREHQLVTRYAYHHGFYDGAEREFRGFGRVDQWDADRFAADITTDTAPTNDYIIPVRTTTWFHTGAFFEATTLEEAFAGEYFHETPGNPSTPPPVPRTPTLADVGTLTPTERRHAVRALKGQMLRQEVWRDDDRSPAAPYTVTQTTWEVLCRQPAQPSDAPSPWGRETGAPAVFQTVVRGSVTFAYDEDPTDPRVVQQLVLEVNALTGTPRTTAAVAYPRRENHALLGMVPETDPPEPVASPQDAPVVVVTTRDVVHQQTADILRLDVPWQLRRWEVGGLTFPEAGGLWTWEALAEAYDTDVIAEGDDLGPHTVAPTSGGWRRLLGYQVVRYADATTGDPLALGDPGDHALPYDTATLAFTLDLLADASSTNLGSGLDTRADWDSTARDAALAEGGYLLGTAWLIGTPPGGFAPPADVVWAPSGATTYGDASAFFQPATQTDPFGTTTTLTWDALSLQPVQVDVPIVVTGGTVTHTVSAVLDATTRQPTELTDVNGARTAAAFDALGRVTKVATLGRPGDTVDDLDHPTSAFDYTFASFDTVWTPACAHASVRRLHWAGGTTTTFDEAWSYTDGLGRPLMTKVPAAPHPDFPSIPRFIGTGRVMLDAKGNPVKQYEPFFSDTSDWEPDSGFDGVTPILRYDPLGRQTETLHPDGTTERVERTPWEERHFDRNDTVTADWLTSAGITGAVQTHYLNDIADTPTLIHSDPLGRPFLEQRLMAPPATPGDYAEAETTDIHTTLNLLGATVQVEARYHLEGDDLSVRFGQLATTDVVDLLGRSLRHVRRDAQTFGAEESTGTTWVLPAVDGQPLRRWDCRAGTWRLVYDALRRPTETWRAQGGGDELLLLRTVYGEAYEPADLDDDDAQTRFLYGKGWRMWDPSGRVETSRYDVDGRPTASTRRLATVFWRHPDWAESETDPDVGLAAEELTTSFTWDLTGRSLTQTTPDGTIDTRTYDEGGRLLSIAVNERGATMAKLLVESQLYNERGQRVEAKLGRKAADVAALRTVWTYDPTTFRLVNLTTTRDDNDDGEFDGDDTVLQDLTYSYDAVGNILAIADGVAEVVYAGVGAVTADRTFQYDALDRLIEATGREHSGTFGPLAGMSSQFGTPLAHPHDNSNLRNYVQTYSYNAVGNILTMAHAAGSSTTRTYAYALGGDGKPFNNQVVATTRPGDDPEDDPATWTDQYEHDEHGSMTLIPGVGDPQWNDFDHLASLEAAETEAADRWYYTYDADRRRVRKVRAIVTDPDTEEEVITVSEERIYVGDWETWRSYSSGDLDDAIESRHVRDEQRRIAILETRTMEEGEEVEASTWRLQLDNHLGTGCVETTFVGAILSYEEYHPYGTTAFRSGSGEDVSLKRHRYTGMERDEETGLSYHISRYHCSWLGFWISVDQEALKDGSNHFSYTQNSPASRSDVSGRTTDQNLEMIQEARNRPPDPLLVTLQTAERAQASARRGESTPQTLHMLIDILEHGIETRDETPREFIDHLLSVTRGPGKAGILAETAVKAFEIGVQFRVSLNDGDFKDELKDIHRGSPNQLGHFLTAVAGHLDGGTDPFLTKSDIDRLKVEFGHETMPDNYFAPIPGMTQGYQAAYGFVAFSDDDVRSIFAGNYSIIFSSERYPITPSREGGIRGENGEIRMAGNSEADVRLTILGAQFAMTLRSGGFTTKESMADWIRINLLEPK